MVNTDISWWRRRQVEEYPADEIPDRPGHRPRQQQRNAGRAAPGHRPAATADAGPCYYEDMSEAEIAAVLGVSLGTVKSPVSRAVAKLRIGADLPEG
jgi:DNA-directed RNA polymerase specialized sigma24 family protein